MKKILVSACLLGEAVRYDGRDKALDDRLLRQLLREDRVIGFCPEVGGGLPIPRPAAEIQNGGGAAVIAGHARVLTDSGDDVTDYFLAGARQALELCQEHEIRAAVLTESSPSCGGTQIYDGSFSRRAIAGAGVTAALLRSRNIAVFNQHQLRAAVEYLDSAGARD